MGLRGGIIGVEENLGGIGHVVGEGGKAGGIVCHRMDMGFFGSIWSVLLFISLVAPISPLPISYTVLLCVLL